MQQSITHAWHELSEGNYAAAERIFQQFVDQDTDTDEALRGLARVALHRGDLQRAESLARQAMSMDANADVQLLLGEILGAQGKRREAEQCLTHAVSYHTSDAYARALLGEQIVRQGRWEEGTNQFIQALSDDQNGDGFRHLQKVLADLVEACSVGRVPQNEAMKFVNRLDYSVPKSGPEMQSFFGEARRALNNGQPLARRDYAPEKTMPDSVRQRAGGRGGPQSAAPPSSRPAPSSAPPQRRAQPSGSSSPPQRASSPPARQTATADSSSSTGAAIDPNRKDLQALIQHERSLNRKLLDDVARMDPPAWPSEASNNIDNVPPISLDRGSVLGDASGIDTRDFRVTTGDLLAEIFLERCLRNLLVATQQHKSTTIPLRPESIVQMELNCRDGLLDKMRPLSPLYTERPGYEDFRQLALGMFIGECLATAYDGTWTYQTPASESYLEIGTMLLEPFEVVARWMGAADKDDVSLQYLARQARRASRKSTSLTITQDYIDPTRELTGAALESKLAALWASYRFSLSDTAFSQFAESLEVVSAGPATVIFKIGSKWVPNFARGPQDAAILDDDKVALAYLRATGEFVALASRKGLARYLEASHTKLDQDAARAAIELLKNYHRPGWWVAASEKQASNLSQKVGRSVDSPQLRTSRGQSTLVIEGVSSQGPVRWQLEFDADALLPWTLDVTQADA